MYCQNSELEHDFVSIRDVRDINVDEILGRVPVKLDNSLTGNPVAGASVLVSGAGGSIEANYAGKSFR